MHRCRSLAVSWTHGAGAPTGRPPTPRAPNARQSADIQRAHRIAPLAGDRDVRGRDDHLRQGADAIAVRRHHASMLEIARNQTPLEPPQLRDIWPTYRILQRLVFLPTNGGRLRSPLVRLSPPELEYGRCRSAYACSSLLRPANPQRRFDSVTTRDPTTCPPRRETNSPNRADRCHHQPGRRSIHTAHNRRVTTRASYRRRVRRERFEWPPEDCIPGSPWTGGSLRFGNRLRRTFGCGSTRRLSA